MDELELSKQWHSEARDMTIEKLPDFIEKMTAHEHDYGTICHAISASAIAAAWAVERSPHGGITGFQASCIMWDFISHWMSYEGKAMRLVDYDNLLYPQYSDEFTQLSRDTWEATQKKAAEFIAEKETVHPDVLAHWKSIVAGNVPFGLSVEKETADAPATES